MREVVPLTADTGAGPRPELEPEDAALLELLTEAALARAPEPLARWYAPNELRAAYRSDLREAVAWLRDEAFGRRYAANCPVPGAAPPDYLNRHLELPGLGEAVLGIRFRALDMERPFVEVVASTGALDLGADPRELRRTVAAAFAPFAPKHLVLHRPRVEGVDLSALPGAFWDMRWLAAPLTEVAAAPLSAAAVELVRPPDLAFYTEYAALLEARYAREPELREWTRTESEEDLAGYLGEGTLFRIHVDGRPAGLLVVTRDARAGMRGFYVVEIVLAEWARGRWIGSAMQVRLARRLEARPGDLLFGTIHANNVPALRAAQRVGRVDVGGELWLPL